MIDRIKGELFSKNGMKIVNILFFLSIFIRNRVFIICSFTTWLIYLMFSIKHTTSKTMKFIKHLCNYNCCIKYLFSNIQINIIIIYCSSFNK